MAQVMRPTGWRKHVGYPAQTLVTPGGHTSRYTDVRTIEIFSAAAASVNQQITAELTALGINVVGLAGPNVIYARRKTAIRAIRDGRQVIVRDDYTGTITGINRELLQTLLDAGITPVIAPVAMGEAFERLNVDGDLIAAQVTAALGADTLIILSNVPGLLRDMNDANSLVATFTLQDLSSYESLAAGTNEKEIMAAQQANAGRVILADSRIETPIDAALAGGGTHILADGHYTLSAVSIGRHADYDRHHD